MGYLPDDFTYNILNDIEMKSLYKQNLNVKKCVNYAKKKIKLSKMGKLMKVNNFAFRFFTKFK